MQINVVNVTATTSCPEIIANTHTRTHLTRLASSSLPHYHGGKEEECETLWSPYVVDISWWGSLLAATSGVAVVEIA